MEDLSGQKVLLKDIMTKKVVAVSPETSLIEAARILSEKKFSGMPVIDKKNKLVGILTEYDLISKEDLLHLPTFQKILENLAVYRKNRHEISAEIKQVSRLKVKDVMNDDPLTLQENATLESTVRTFKDHHRVNPIPVLDQNKKVVGVISRFDLIKPLYAKTIRA
ncbi:CBS domain-containing protein [Candidatus Giovannonibacteria bacterium]|nr:CBS domain-containing protein [Candidatus Giovannonibacteria bacterium]